MGFRLPTYQDLSLEQDSINNLPLEGRQLVVGPPGTGKTVLAIYRSMQFEKAGLNTMFIVYNKVLNEYLRKVLVENCPSAEHKTKDSFLWSWWRKNYRSDPPRPARATSQWELDWDAMLRKLLETPPTSPVKHLVVDEAQDFEPSMFPALALIADRASVFADQNQRITANSSLIKDIQLGLELNERQVHKLTRNYRNTRQIAEVARCFFTGDRKDPQGGIPDLPETRGETPGVRTYKNAEELADLIVKHASENPKYYIGVLFKNKNRLLEIKRQLTGRLNGFQWYFSGEEPPNFEQPGVTLLTFASSKGLEFDSVFLPYLDQLLPPEASLSDEQATTLKMEMYVMVSRARSELRLLYEAGKPYPAILQVVEKEEEKRRDKGDPPLLSYPKK